MTWLHNTSFFIMYIWEYQRYGWAMRGKWWASEWVQMSNKFFFIAYSMPHHQILSCQWIHFSWRGKIFLVEVQNILPCGQRYGVKRHTTFLWNYINLFQQSHQNVCGHIIYCRFVHAPEAKHLHRAK
jgi:hypothetical protein